jgi:hypothetical protein
MNLTDLLNNSLTMTIEHTGDNETDSHTVKFSTTILDMNGQEMSVDYQYNLTKSALDELEDNLHYMLKRVQRYMQDFY